MRKLCKNPECRKIIIEDLKKWLKENPNVFYLQCPYCYETERIRR